MREVRYSVAMSLDGFLAGPAGEVDWLPEELDMDWGAFMARFDTAVMGRATYDFMRTHGGDLGGMKTVVCSRTVSAEEAPGVTVTADAAATVASLRQEGGKEIWLMGGGQLFASLLEADLVDLVEVALVPILLGRGIPFHPGAEALRTLTLVEAQDMGRGVHMLSYRVDRAEGRA